jgi:proteasome lid subunit RPN8/RPN11
MLQAVFSNARQLVEDLSWKLLGRRSPIDSPCVPSPQRPVRYQALQRLLLTDGVGRTLFEEYAAHRSTMRGEEETGWVLMGLRGMEEAVALATLPAGAKSEASAAHVRFNSMGQAVASRIVRQSDRRLTILGVVHTHPGSLRHPSDGDLRGDREWIAHLRGKEGIFGIGTAEGESSLQTLFAEQPRPHVQCLGDMCLSWYALGQRDARYRPLPVGVTLGPDLARPLHSVWSVVEANAERLERLFKQQAGVTFEVAEGKKGPELVVNVPLSEPQHAVRVALRDKDVQFYLRRGDEIMEADCPDERVDRGVYLLLAELAAQA